MFGTTSNKMIRDRTDSWFWRIIRQNQDFSHSAPFTLHIWTSWKRFWLIGAGTFPHPAAAVRCASVRLTNFSLQCALYKSVCSPPLFVKRWTSLAAWRAVSPAGEREERESERERRGIIHSLCAQSAVEITRGNETADRGERWREGGGVHTRTRTNTLPRNLKLHSVFDSLIPP